VLNDSFVGLGDSTPLAPGFRTRIERAIDKERTARATCALGKQRPTKRGLAASARLLAKIRATLASKRAGTIGVRDDLLREVDALRATVKALRAAVRCPDDAGMPGS